MSEHWNTIFLNKKDSELGWYENDAAQTLKFLDLIPPRETTTIFLPGAGTSVLIDALLAKGHQLILNDISDVALSKLRTRIGENDNVSLMHYDIAHPLPDGLAKTIDIWIDRAVLHFLLKESDIQGYFSNLHAAVRSGGYVLLAEFATTGAQKCAGLELHRYSIEEMTLRMGKDFELIKHEEYIFINPSGDTRPYIYGLFKRLAGH